MNTAGLSSFCLSNGSCVGRIAGIINDAANNKWRQKANTLF